MCVCRCVYEHAMVHVCESEYDFFQESYFSFHLTRHWPLLLLLHSIFQDRWPASFQLGLLFLPSISLGVLGLQIHATISTSGFLCGSHFIKLIQRGLHLSHLPHSLWPFKRMIL